jgi:hypothetical protein
MWPHPGFGALPILALWTAGTLCAPAAWGQWNLIGLAQPGDRLSYVNAVGGGMQGGTRFHGSIIEPGYWEGSGASWHSLYSGRNAEVTSLFGNQQGGYSQPPTTGGSWACMWSGTPESLVYLNPSGYSGSAISGMWGDEQVGGATPPTGLGGAALWHGTAASIVMLAPAGSEDSVARATDGVHQYGYAQYASAHRATMWSGTAASATNINPAGYVESEIWAAIPGLQVGWAETSSHHAGVWFGSAASFVDLDPPGMSSEAYGVCDSAVVGYVTAGGLQWSPAIWLGPSFEFQQLPIPAGYTSAYATSVEFRDGVYYVGGYAQGPTSNADAFLWVGVPAPPSSVALLALAGLWAGRRRRASA